MHADEISSAMQQVINSGWFLQGESIRRFENNYSNYIGTRHCVTCGNGLDALSLILRAYKELGKLKDGDEIIVPANTYIAPILASAGIVGLAVGFGAQELVRDFISGFFILLEDQLRTGDWAIINGTEGLVEKIELRTVTLRDSSGVVHIFQNGKIDTLSNMTKEWSAIVLQIGIGYKEDTDNAVMLMQQVGDEMFNDPVYKEMMLEPVAISGVNDFADSAVIIRLVIKTKPMQQWAVGREYRRRLKKVFDAKNVEFPFPYRTLTWGDNSNPIKLKIEPADSDSK